MTAPRSVKVGRVELTWKSYAWFSGDNLYSIRQLIGGRQWRAHGFSLYADGGTPEAAADALTAKLKQLRAALADVLGEEEGS